MVKAKKKKNYFPVPIETFVKGALRLIKLNAIRRRSVMIARYIYILEAPRGEKRIFIVTLFPPPSFDIYLASLERDVLWCRSVIIVLITWSL